MSFPTGHYVELKDTICNLDTTINFKIEFLEPTKFVANAGITNNPIACSPFEAIFFNNGDAENHYWNFDDGSFSTKSNPKHKYKKSGKYTVKYIGINSSYCIPVDTLEIEVEVIKVQSLFGSIDFERPKTCTYYSLNLDVTGKFTGHSADSIIWDWGDNSQKIILTNGDVYNLVKHTYTKEGKYTLKVELFDRLCGNDTILKIPFEHRKIGENGSIIAPNIFTPNNDKINDQFKLFFVNRKNYDVYEDIVEYRTIVFDRWGNKVFDSKKINLNEGDPPSHWNGKYNGDESPTGVYFYISTFKIRCYDDGNDTKTRTIKGHVTISK